MPEDSLFYRLITRGNLPSIREQYAQHIQGLAEKSAAAQNLLQEIHDDLTTSPPKKYLIEDYTTRQQREHLSDILYLTGLPGPREPDGGTYYHSLEAIIKGKPSIETCSEQDKAMYMRTKLHIQRGIMGGVSVGIVPGVLGFASIELVKGNDIFISAGLIGFFVLSTLGGLSYGLGNPGARNPHLVLKYEIAQRTEEMLKILSS